MLQPVRSGDFITRKTTPAELVPRAFALIVRTNVPGLYETTVEPSGKYVPSTITSPTLSAASFVFTAAVAPEKLHVGWFTVAVRRRWRRGACPGAAAERERNHCGAAAAEQ